MNSYTERLRKRVTSSLCDEGACGAITLKGFTQREDDYMTHIWPIWLVKGLSRSCCCPSLDNIIRLYHRNT